MIFFCTKHATQRLTGTTPEVVLRDDLSANPHAPRQREILADGKGGLREKESEDNPRQNTSQTNRNRIREGLMRQRGTSPKLDTCTKRHVVYPTNISGKVARFTLGGLMAATVLPASRWAIRRQQSHSKCRFTAAQTLPNMKNRE